MLKLPREQGEIPAQQALHDNPLCNTAGFTNVGILHSLGLQKSPEGARATSMYDLNPRALCLQRETARV